MTQELQKKLKSPIYNYFSEENKLNKCFQFLSPPKNSEEIFPNSKTQDDDIKKSEMPFNIANNVE